MSMAFDLASCCFKESRGKKGKPLHCAGRPRTGAAMAIVSGAPVARMAGEPFLHAKPAAGDRLDLVGDNLFMVGPPELLALRCAAMANEADFRLAPATS